MTNERPFRVYGKAAAKTPKPPRRKPSPVMVNVRVNRTVWSAAVNAAGGDPSRIVIEGDGSVLIRNAGR